MAQPLAPFVQRLISSLELQPHPEGGYYKETYRSAANIGDRSLSTAIYFLLPAGQRSHLHRIKSDELWHYHLGGPLIVTQISPAGKVEEIRIGPDVEAGQKLQHAVPAGYWFGSRPADGTEFTVVGCTVAPGFDFADFEMGKRADLLREFPAARSAIERLTV
jgi:predicted cupin superfamily sugar epimerase